VSDKPKEFTDVIKPAPSPIANPVSPPSTTFEGKEWSGFMANVNDNYIKVLREYAPKNEFIIEVDGKANSYTRKKIKVKDYADLEKIRAQFNKAQSTGDVERATELQFEIYIKCAEYYLGMTKEDFENADFEEVKKVCDAANFRTLHGVPN